MACARRPIILRPASSKPLKRPRTLEAIKNRYRLPTHRSPFRESITSYMTLVSNCFDKAVHFYGVELGFPLIEGWDRINGRGQRFDLRGGLRLEILDNQRERRPLRLCDPAEGFHVVVEADDIEAARRSSARLTPQSQT